MKLVKYISFLLRYHIAKKVFFCIYLFVLIFELLFIKCKNAIMFNIFQYQNSQIISNYTCNFSPLITISIPLYNKISYLERLTLSILQFTNTKRNEKNIKFEMVVVDTNSNDGSYEFFVNLALILNGLHNHQTKNEIIDKYNLNQFIINDNKRFRSSFRRIPYARAEVLKYDRSCISIKIFRQKKRIPSNIARQICVEKSCGLFIWQVDPDDMINTPSLGEIVNMTSKSNNTDIIEFSFFYHLIKKNGRKMTMKFRKKNIEMKSNHEIVEQFLTKKKNQWQLWQCFVRRSIYMKAIKTIKEMVPNQEKVNYASDLFHYIPITYHCNSYLSLNVFGYHYFYRNNGSVSLMAAKNEINSTEGKNIVFGFIENLYNNTGIPLPYNYLYY